MAWPRPAPRPLATLQPARGLGLLATVGGLAALVVGCAGAPGAPGVGALLPAAAPAYPAPDHGQAHARLLLRGTVGPNDRYGAVALADAERCREPQLMAQGTTAQAPGEVRLAVDRLLTVDLVIRRAGAPACGSRWSFKPQPGRTYLARMATAGSACIGGITDVTQADQPALPPDLVQRNGPAGTCLPLAQSRAVRNPLDGGQHLGDAVLLPQATARDLEGLSAAASATQAIQPPTAAPPPARAAMATGQALGPAEVFARVGPSVWRVQTFDADGLLLGQGSGVVVAPQQLVTNCHVLAKARRVQVRREASGAALPAALALWDVHRDLCTLQVPGLGAPAVALAPSDPVVVGQPAYAIGHPKNLELTMSAGLVSSLRRNAAQQLVLVQTSAAVSGGSSGGGLFDTQARLLGLTTLASVTGDAQNLNFAVPADWIADLPRRHAAARAAERASAVAR